MSLRPRRCTPSATSSSLQRSALTRAPAIVVYDFEGNELGSTKSWTRAPPPRMLGRTQNNEEQTHENRNHRHGQRRRHAGAQTDGAGRTAAHTQLAWTGVAGEASQRCTRSG